MSRALRDLDTGTLVNLRVRAIAFRDDPLWAALQAELNSTRTRIMTDLTERSTPAEHLKFAQGELAQVNRDILLVDNFLDAVAKEQERREKMAERR